MATLTVPDCVSESRRSPSRGGAFAQSPGLPLHRCRRPGRLLGPRRPRDVKNVQTKKLGANFIDTSEPGYAAAHGRRALSGDALHVRLRRGLPERRGAAQQARRAVRDRQRQRARGPTRLKALTGEGIAPVLTVGDKLVAKGYNEARWQAMLDEAGLSEDAAAAPYRAGRPGREPPPPVAGRHAVRGRAARAAATTRSSDSAAVPRLSRTAGRVRNAR